MENIKSEYVCPPSFGECNEIQKKNCYCVMVLKGILMLILVTIFYLMAKSLLSKRYYEDEEDEEEYIESC